MAANMAAKMAAKPRVLGANFLINIEHREMIFVSKSII